MLTVWAKHDRDCDGWLPLWRHMEDSAAVAGRLWDEWLPVSVRNLIAHALPRGEDDARRLAVWLAAVHDIGKATPAFACQVEPLAQTMRDHGLEMRSQQAMGPDRRLAPHGLAGQLLLAAVRPVASTTRQPVKRKRGMQPVNPRLRRQSGRHWRPFGGSPRRA